jgi:hypothetical protein
MLWEKLSFMSKNNQNEYMKRMEPQRQRFALRKLTVGVASVLLGITFFVGGTQADADSLTTTSANRATPTTVSTTNEQGLAPSSNQLTGSQQESTTVTAQLANSDGSMRDADGQQVMAHNDNVQVTVNYQNNRLPAGQPITISYSNPSQWTVVDWEDGVSKQLGNDLTATNNGHGTFTVKSNMDKDLDINFALHFALQYAGDVESNTLTPLVITTKRGNATVNTKTVKPIIIPYKDHVVADEIAHGWAAKDVHKVKTNFDNTHDILSGTKATTGKEADNREVMQYMIEWNYGKAGNTKGTTLSPLQTADFTAYLSKGQTMLPDTIKVFRVYQPNAVDGNGQRVSIDKSYSKITDCVNGVFVNEDPAFEQFLKDHLTVTVNNSTTQLSWRDYQTALQKAKHDGTEPPLVNGIHLKESDMAHVKLSTDANGQSHNFSVNSGDNEDSTVKSPHSTFFIQFDTLLDYNMPVSWTTPGDGPSISYNRASGKFGGVGTQIDKSTSKVFQGGGNGFTHQMLTKQPFTLQILPIQITSHPSIGVTVSVP